MGTMLILMGGDEYDDEDNGCSRVDSFDFVMVVVVIVIVVKVEMTLWGWWDCDVEDGSNSDNVNKYIVCLLVVIENFYFLNYLWKFYKNNVVVGLDL